VTNYTELHFHILPGLDDGPARIEDSLALAAAAVSDGTRRVLATPHINRVWPNEPHDIHERVRELDERLQAERIELEVLAGAELSPEMVPTLSDRQLEQIAHGPPGRRWLLLEAPLGGLDPRFTAAADELRSRGFAIVVAHPERALQRLESAWPLVEHELAAGSALQVNAWSVAGRYGDRIRLTALQLLERSTRVALASDAHGRERMPSLTPAIDALEQMGMRDPGRLSAVVPGELLAHGLELRPAAVAA
jgi:protein-tyrosine phosphatase